MNILEEIATKRREDIGKRKQINSYEEVHKKAVAIAQEEYEEKGYFTYPFQQAISKSGIQYICEVKKASPSKGVIAEVFPYLEIAKEYEKAGAAAISCLTEPEYFLGRDEYLREIVEAVDIPVLRKDFTIDAYQIYEAKILGASAVLLICALLDDSTLKEFLEITKSLGLSALVEAHDEEEVRRAMAAGANIIGVNNRDLRTFAVDIQNSVRLRGIVDKDILFVSESGIKTREDIKVLEENGTNAVLIGETLMKSDNKRKELERLNGKPMGGRCE